MLRSLLPVLLAAVPTDALAGTVGFELSFAPFTGDLAADAVAAVPGTVSVWLDGIFVAEQPVAAEELMVLFDAREVSPALWLPTSSHTELLHPGENHYRLVFTPDDPATPYTAQLRWASVSDVTREERRDGALRGTNLATQGLENREATGSVTFEGTFLADWATAQPWHAWPAVDTVTPADRTWIAMLLAQRTSWFLPPFEILHGQLKRTRGIDAAHIRKARCLEAAWKAGLRITAAPAESLEIETTGTAVVVLRGEPYRANREVLGDIHDPEKAFCAAVALGAIYAPPVRLVRRADGFWTFAQ